MSVSAAGSTRTASHNNNATIAEQSKASAAQVIQSEADFKNNSEGDDDDDSSDEDYVPGNDNDNDNDDQSNDEEEDKVKADVKKTSSFKAKKNNKNNDRNDDEAKATLKEIKNANYSKIESSSGGLIKTRTQRLKEASESKDYESLKVLNDSSSSSTIDIDSIWNEMKSSGNNVVKAFSPDLGSSNSSSAKEDTPVVHDLQDEKIKITRKYEYAGETIVENKWVLKSSAEAKAYLNSSKLKADEASSKNNNGIQHQQQQQSSVTNQNISKAPQIHSKPLRKRKAKKSSIVDDIIKGSKMAKINTLEKSRLDWANYVDNNKLNDELRKHNKDGYLSKQDFLNRVEHNIDNKIKQSKKLQ